MRIQVDVFHHVEGGTPDASVVAKLNQIILNQQTQGVTMSALSDAVDALVARINEDVQHLLDLLAASQASEAAALEAEAASAEVVAAAQADRDAALSGRASDRESDQRYRSGR